MGFTWQSGVQICRGLPAAIFKKTTGVKEGVGHAAAIFLWSPMGRLRVAARLLTSHFSYIFVLWVAWGWAIHTLPFPLFPLQPSWSLALAPVVLGTRGPSWPQWSLATWHKFSGVEHFVLAWAFLWCSGSPKRSWAFMRAAGLSYACLGAPGSWPSFC